ncbi:hypothetical protein EO238_27960, partial [Citrobacter sp. AAK_AS5]
MRPLIAEDEAAEQEEATPAEQPEPDRVVIAPPVIVPEANIDFRNRVVIKSCLLAACFSLIFGVLVSPIGSGV